MMLAHLLWEFLVIDLDPLPIGPPLTIVLFSYALNLVNTRNKLINFQTHARPYKY